MKVDGVCPEIYLLWRDVLWSSSGSFDGRAVPMLTRGLHALL